MTVIVMAAMATGCINDEVKGADLKVGDRLPDFEMIMSDGSIVGDDDLKGRVSVVVFFHTLCSDCQKELPVIQRIYDEYAPKGVVFAPVSRAEGKDSVEAYWERNGLEMPYSAQNDRNIYEMFAGERIPRIYINDKDGVIRFIYTDDPVPGYDELVTALESL